MKTGQLVHTTTLKGQTLLLETQSFFYFSRNANMNRMIQSESKGLPRGPWKEIADVS